MPSANRDGAGATIPRSEVAKCRQQAVRKLLMSAKPLNVWCVLDRKPGHRSLARGMVAAIGTARPVAVTEVSAAPWISPVGKCLQFIWPCATRLAVAACPSQPHDDSGPDLIVSSGGNVLWFTAPLARTLRSPSVFVGSRRHLPIDAVSAFVHYDPSLEREGTLCVPLLPGPAGPKEQGIAWGLFADDRGLDPCRRRLVALIGGNGGGYRWDDLDGHRLGQAMRMWHESTGREWLVTTSRRTPKRLESALREELPRSAIADACWFHAGDRRRVVSAYLGGADAVFVGEDSGSMIHEALSSGRPVITLRPRQAQPPSAHRDYLDTACKRGWLAMLPLEHAQDFNAGTLWDRGLGYPGDPMAEIGRMLLDHLAQRGHTFGTS